MSFRSVLCLALIHTLVDSFAQLITPLWPRLKREMGLEPWSFTLLIAVWQVATSVSQPLFGYWGDRFGSRALVALGPALAVVCLSLIGFAGEPLFLAGLLVIGGLGIGAFHPEAAASVVDASGTRSASGLAVFTFGGMLGLGLGPLLSGFLAQGQGPRGLAWALLPGLLILGLLLLVLRPVHHPVTHRAEPTGLAEIVAGRWGSVVLLLGVATLRVVPALGVPLGLAFVLDHQGRSEIEIGQFQSLFLLSGGLGTLVCPLLAQPGRERFALVATICPAAGCLLLLPWEHPAALWLGLAGSGLFLQGAIPILIAYSQRLLPRGRRLASSLTLGASWGLGGIIVAGLQAHFSATGYLHGMLWAMVPFALAAALASCLLPDPAQTPGLAATGS